MKKQTREQKIAFLERMLRQCPDVMTPKSVFKWTHFGRNRVYEMLKSGELPSYTFQGGYIITKEDLIEYLVEHSDDAPPKKFAIKGGEQK